MKRSHLWIPILLGLAACQPTEAPSDAYGNFEAVEVMISAEVQGPILAFDAREGSRIREGTRVVVIDTFRLALQRNQLKSGLAAIDAQMSSLEAELNAQQVQMDNLRREIKRTERLVEGGAATLQQQDDLEGQRNLLEARMAATASRKAQIRAEREKLDQQILQVDDQIRRCHVISPVTGTLLAKYRERGELAVPGQPLFKVANLDSLILRAFITGSQLSEVAPGQPVDVRFDTPEGLVGVRGRVTWISEASEFTPKIIQTREERVNLVYAIKVITPNDGGKLKIGMPGEVRF